MNKNIEIMNKIESYGRHINSFRDQLNIHGIWLFTSTLGCWGVNDAYIKVFATICLLFIFTFLVQNGVNDNRPFKNIREEIKTEVMNNLDGDTQKARLYELSQVEKNRNSVKIILKKSPVFITCYIFYSISLITFIFQLPK